MYTRLALPMLFAASLGVLTAPSFASQVKVPTGGDIVTVTIPVINLSDYYISGASFSQASTGFLFTSYTGQFHTLSVTAPHTTGLVGYEFIASGTFTEQPSFPLPLYGFSSSTATIPGYTDIDPLNTIDLVSQDGGPCGLESPCKDFTSANTITVPASSTSPTTVPEPAPTATFGLGALVLGGLVLKARKRQNSGR